MRSATQMYAPNAAGWRPFLFPAMGLLRHTRFSACRISGPPTIRGLPSHTARFGEWDDYMCWQPLLFFLFFKWLHVLTALVLLLLPSLAVAEPVVTVYLGRPLPTILLHLYQRASLGYNDSSISKIVGTRTQRERGRGTDMHTYSRSLQEGGTNWKEWNILCYLH